MEYEPYCEEHDLKLIRGECLNCRDQNGEMFVLDTQSIYLKPVEVQTSEMAEENL